MFHAILSLAILTGAAGVSQPGAEEPAPLDQDVANAARYFRIQVYHSFRYNRGEYNRHRAAGDNVLSQWKEADQPAGARDAVIQWFEQARHAAYTGAQLPTAPDVDAARFTPEGSPLPVGPPPVLPSPPASTGSVLDAPAAADDGMQPLGAGPPPVLPGLAPATGEELKLDARPSATEPAATKPAATEPAATEPAAATPAETVPAADSEKPAATPGKLPPLPAPAPWNDAKDPRFGPTPRPITTPSITTPSITTPSITTPSTGSGSR